MGKDEESHGHAGNVMDFREHGHRNNQKNIPEKPCQFRDLDDPGSKCQNECDDQSAIDEIIQPAFARHLVSLQLVCFILMAFNSLIL